MHQEAQDSSAHYSEEVPPPVTACDEGEEGPTRTCTSGSGSSSDPGSSSSSDSSSGSESE